MSFLLKLSGKVYDLQRIDLKIVLTNDNIFHDQFADYLKSLITIIVLANANRNVRSLKMVAELLRLLQRNDGTPRPRT